MTQQPSECNERIEALESEVRELRKALDSGSKGILRQSLQIQSIISLLLFLKPRYPLPSFTEWAIAADMGLLLASHIMQKKPRFVVETGSGLSSLVAGYCLKRAQYGRILSIEHDAHFARKTQDLINQHKLENFVSICYSPLEETNLYNEPRLWYSNNCLDFIEPASIELLFVDGPPGVVQKMSRYPALPILYKYLAPNVSIILDDAHRSDELAITSAWRREFPEFEVQMVDTLRGASVFTREK